MTVILITVIEVCDDGSAVMEADLAAECDSNIRTSNKSNKSCNKTNRKRQEEMATVGVVRRGNAIIVIKLLCDYDSSWQRQKKRWAERC